jgi:uracil-DNA glycosylase family 4
LPAEKEGVRDKTMADKRKALGELNGLIKNCKSCDLSQTRRHALGGEGNLDARVMLIAQAPGDREDQEGRMFIGPSGKVLDELLHEGGVSREELFMTNLIKCALPGNRRPKQAEIDACAPFLEKEIAVVAPAVIVPLGYYATRFIFSRYSIAAPEPRKEFSALYGNLFLAQNKKIFPLPHPSSLLYNNTFKPKTLEKYRKLRILLRECKWFPACPMKWFYDKGKLDRYWIERYCKGDWEGCVRYQMEEEGRFHPDSMLPDGTLDETLR